MLGHCFFLFWSYACVVAFRSCAVAPPSVPNRGFSFPSFFERTVSEKNRLLLQCTWLLHSISTRTEQGRRRARNKNEGHNLRKKICAHSFAIFDPAVRAIRHSSLYWVKIKTSFLYTRPLSKEVQQKTREEEEGWDNNNKASFLPPPLFLPKEEASHVHPVGARSDFPRDT